MVAGIKTLEILGREGEPCSHCLAALAVTGMPLAGAQQGALPGCSEGAVVLQQCTFAFHALDPPCPHPRLTLPAPPSQAPTSTWTRSPSA